jgi:hypothetical protein
MTQLSAPVTTLELPIAGTRWRHLGSLQATPFAIIDGDIEGKSAAGAWHASARRCDGEGRISRVAGVSYADARRLVNVFNTKSCWLVSVRRHRGHQRETLSGRLPHARIATVPPGCSAPSAEPFPGYATSLPMPPTPVRSSNSPSPNSASGLSKSSAVPMLPRGSNCRRDGGSSSERSHGSTATGAWPRTSKTPSKAPAPGL